MRITWLPVNSPTEFRLVSHLIHGVTFGKVLGYCSGMAGRLKLRLFVFEVLNSDRQQPSLRWKFALLRACVTLSISCYISLLGRSMMGQVMLGDIIVFLAHA